MKRKVVIAVLIVAIIIVAGVVYSQRSSCKTSANCPAGKLCMAGKCVVVTPPGPGPKPPPPGPNPPPIKPRQTNIKDCGYGDRLRGWFDAQDQGAKNDYCRYVGGTATAAPTFQCALAGSDKPYSAPFDAAKLKAAGCDATPGGTCPASCANPLWA